MTIFQQLYDFITTFFNLTAHDDFGRMIRERYEKRVGARDNSGIVGRPSSGYLSGWAGTGLRAERGAMMSKRKKHLEEKEETSTGTGFVSLLFVFLLFAAISIVAVSGCDGAAIALPAANPEAASLYAQATQTAASVNSAATRTEYQVEYAATNNAVMEQETVAAAAATSQAHSTATSDHILAIAAADVTREYAAILADRERGISTATAVAINRQMQADAQEATRQQARADFNDKFWKVLWIALATVGVCALIGALFVGLRRWDGKPDVITDSQNNPVAISKNYQQLRQAHVPAVQVVRSDAPAPAPERTARQNGTEVNLHESPVVLEYAKQRVTFYPRQIATMRQWVVAGDYGVRRDSSMEGQGLREIGINSSAYGLTLSVLQGKGYVSTDTPYKWTDLGVQEFLGLELDD